ncbi:unnamed protein product [Diplocarpon coronariae]
MAKKCDQCVKARLPCPGIDFGATVCGRCVRFSRECTWEREGKYQDSSEVLDDKRPQVAQDLDRLRETAPLSDIQFEISIRGPAGKNLAVEANEEASKDDPQIEPKAPCRHPGQEKLLCCEKVHLISEHCDEDDDRAFNYLYNISKTITGKYPARVATEPKVKHGVIWTDFYKVIGIATSDKLGKKRKFQLYGVNEPATEVVEINHDYPELITPSESFTAVKDSLVRLSRGITWACHTHPNLEWTIFEVGWQTKICDTAGQDFDAMMM